MANRPKRADAQVRSSLNVKQGAAKPVLKPKCPDHHTQMEYEADRGIWHCTEKDCGRGAIPKSDLGSGNQPVIGRGAVEIFMTQDSDGMNRVCLRAQQNNVVLDITELVVNVEKNAPEPISTFGPSTKVMAANSSYVDLTLHVPHVESQVS